MYVANSGNLRCARLGRIDWVNFCRFGYGSVPRHFSPTTIQSQTDQSQDISVPKCSVQKFSVPDSSVPKQFSPNQISPNTTQSKKFQS